MRKDIKDLTTQEIIETCIYALDDKPERMITDGTGLFKDVLLKEY